MSAEPSPDQFGVAQHPPSFAIWRSELVDGFARLETAVCENIAKHGAFNPTKKLFTQRLDDLAALTPSSKLPKTKAEALPQIAADCVALLPLRASIVHSVMRLGRREGEPIAFFHNATDIARGNLQCLVMSREDFERTKSALQSLADRAKL